VYENRVLRRIRGLENGDSFAMRNFSIYRIAIGQDISPIKSRRVMGAEYTRLVNTHTKNQNKYSPKVLYYFGNRDEGCASATWIQQAQNKIKWLNLKKTVMILRRM